MSKKNRFAGRKIHWLVISIQDDEAFMDEFRTLTEAKWLANSYHEADAHADIIRVTHKQFSGIWDRFYIHEMIRVVYKENYENFPEIMELIREADIPDSELTTQAQFEKKLQLRLQHA
jgi:hypothetical protein